MLPCQSVHRDAAADSNPVKTGLGLLDKNLRTVGLETFPFEESARAWEGSVQQDKKQGTSLSESNRPVNIKRVRAVPRRWSTALKKFFLVFTDPEVAHLTRIERKAVWPDTEAHYVSELQVRQLRSSPYCCKHRRT